MVDKIAKFENSELYVAALQKHDVPYHFLPIETGGHNLRLETESCLDKLKQWLADVTKK